MLIENSANFTQKGLPFAKFNLQLRSYYFQSRIKFKFVLFSDHFVLVFNNFYFWAIFGLLLGKEIKKKRPTFPPFNDHYLASDPFLSLNFSRWHIFESKVFIIQWTLKFQATLQCSQKTSFHSFMPHKYLTDPRFSVWIVKANNKTAGDEYVTHSEANLFQGNFFIPSLTFHYTFC